jgi:hypothetical protein
MFRGVKFAPLAIIGALAVVLTLIRAQAPIDLAYTPAQVGNVVGGDGAGGGRSFEQPGRIITFAGNSGDSPYWTYAVPVAGAPGREVWLAW